jgi:hypothetical protein
MEPAVVASLVGRRQMAFAVPCLESLLRCSADPIVLRVHDDGTLTDDDRALIGERLGAAVVTRAEADALVEPELRGYPRLSAFRKQNPLALKLVDVALFERDGVRFCDADILFQRPFAGLFRADVRGPLFMYDRQNAYAVKPWHVLPGRGLRLIGHLNSGIVVAPRSLFDVERLEDFLGRASLEPPVWIEQTAWAMLASSSSSRLLDRHQFAIAPEGVGGGSAIAIHFVSPARLLLTQALEQPRERPVETPVKVVSAGAARVGCVGLAISALRRKFRARPKRTAAVA